ncbi:MAG TPA: endo-1,4-beta-xylanase [Pirellulales bacterium]|nr:endo-1,4-beta-xylanase [Pirellulales bacterium]
MTLRQAAGGKPLIGAALMSSQLEQPALAQLVAAQFDCITAENELKPQLTEPKPGRFHFADSDKLLVFAQAHGIKLIGHTLCWHQGTPSWMFQAPDGRPLTRDEALFNLKRHIDGVMGHYESQILGWDVVNEALSDNSGEYLRDTPARRAIGDDYIVQAFKLARAADPRAELYYNDYSTENPGKRANQIRLIRELKAAGCRIDAVGIQGHFMLKYLDTPAVLEEAIKAFAAEGVKVCISELDVDVLPRQTAGADIAAVEAGDGINPYADGLPAEVAAQQAAYYGRLFEVIARHRDVIERVSFWGTQDGASWLNDWPVRGRKNYPLLWDRDLKPKPALATVLRALAQPHDGS